MENNNHNLEAEQGVLGSLFHLGDYNLDAFQNTVRYLKSSAFYSRSNRLIYDAMKTVGAKNERIDLVTISDYLENNNNLEDAGGFIYLAELMKSAIGASNISAYSRIVRESAIHRFSVDKMQNVIAMMNDTSNGDVYQRLGMLETTISEIMNMGMRNNKSGLKHITEALGDWLDNRDQVLDDGFDKNAFTTGIDSLDEVLGVKGMRRGSLVGVGARPKMGKSAFMMLLANHFGLNLKESVAIFSMEMPSVEIAERSMTNRTMINPEEFYRGTSNEVNGKIDLAFKEMVESSIFIDDRSGLRLSEIQSEARRIRKEKGSIGLICVDYLTLMTAEKADRNDLAYGVITKSLKNLAKELNCVVLLLTQLNRSLESRPDKKPLPSDSRDTGQIEQDVDLWIGLYKESVYDEDSFSPGLTELIVRLNRHGGTGTGYVEMRQGFHVPVSKEDGMRILSVREQKNKEPEQRTTFRRNNKNN